MLDRTKAPAYQSLNDFNLHKIDTVVLDNGIPLHLVNMGKQPVVNIQLIFPAGKKYERFRGQAYFIEKMLGEGTKYSSHHQIHEKFDQYGAFWTVATENNLLILEIYVLSKYIEPVLEVCKELLLASIFPKERLRHCQHIALANLKVNLSKTNYLAARKFKHLLLGLNHPYGYTLESKYIQQMNTTKLGNFYENYIQNKCFEILVAGNIQEHHIATINNILGKAAVEENKKAKIPEIISTTGFFSVEKKDALQSSLRIGRILPFTVRHHDFFPFLILNKILGGYFGSRLMQNIREEKGYTYGIHSSLVPFDKGYYFAIGTDVKKEKTDEALAEITKECEKLQLTLVSEEELELVKNYTAGSYLKSINTPVHVASCFKRVRFFNLPDNYYNRFVSNIYRVTSAQIQDAAIKYLQDKDMIKVIAG